MLIVLFGCLSSDAVNISITILSPHFLNTSFISYVRHVTPAPWGSASRKPLVLVLARVLSSAVGGLSVVEGVGAVDDHALTYCQLPETCFTDALRLCVAFHQSLQVCFW